MRLAQWQTPQAMHAVTEATVNALGSANLFNQSGLAFLRDAWIAAQFGEMQKAEQVRLVSDNWPDFELIISGQTTDQVLNNIIESIQAPRQ